VALEVRALEKEKIKEILEDPGKLFNWALEVLREEYPEDFEDPVLVEQYVNSLSRWINDLQLDLKLLYIFSQSQGFSFKDCVKTCRDLSGKSRSECTHRCGLVKAVLEGRFNEPPI
jgi:hypothetical protein